MSAAGTYTMEMNTPMGKQEGKLVIESADGALTGHMESMGNKADIENGKVDGDKMTWECKITSPMPMTINFEGTHAGNQITGEAALGAFGKAPFTATSA